jgi:Fur family ferric uptake transcriptional regulator
MAKKQPALVQEIRDVIRSSGLRCTMARVQVLERLHAARTPQSHADLAAELSPLGFDKATIYRNLVELAEVGILSRVELGDHVWRFELKRDRGERDKGEHDAEHPHFVCVDCGEVACLPGVSVNVSDMSAKKSVIGEVTQVVLKGRCERCV